MEGQAIGSIDVTVSVKHVWVCNVFLKVFGIVQIVISLKMEEMLSGQLLFG